MTKAFFILFLAGICMLASCEKVIPYKGDDKDPLLVVNSITEVDSAISVQLERSIFFLESNPGDVAITSGAVLILTNETTGQTYSPAAPDEFGNYDFPVTAQQGNTYSLSVSHPSYKSVQSAMSVPAAVPIISVDTSGYSSDEGALMQAIVKWNDPGGGNYYVLKIAVIDTGGGGVLYPDIVLASSDPSMDELSAAGVGETMSFMPHLFFTDQLFDGSQKTLDVRFYDVAQGFPDAHYVFQLFNCSEATYKYLVSTEKAAMASNDFFAEPVKVITNIENGYGIFSAMGRAVFVK